MQELHRFTGCPLCASKAFDAYAVAPCTKHALWKPVLAPEMVWMRCDDCGHIFRDGYLTDEACAVIFADTHENQKVGHEIELSRVASARLIDKVLAYRDAGRWLDVGFGNGVLLMTAQEYGFTPVGLDLRRGNVDALNDFGIEARCCEIGALDNVARFDVVSMCDVLEHTAYPGDVLRKAHDLLNDGGVLALSLPNTDCAVWRAMDGAGINPYWREIEHVHNFSKQRLYALLGETGFKPVRYGVSERYRACMEVIATKG